MSVTIDGYTVETQSFTNAMQVVLKDGDDIVHSASMPDNAKKTSPAKKNDLLDHNLSNEDFIGKPRYAVKIYASAKEKGKI